MKKSFKIFLLISITILLLGYTIYNYPNIPSTQTLHISATHLIHSQTVVCNLETSLLCALNLFCVVFIIFFLNWVLSNEIEKDHYNLIFLGLLAGIVAALPSAGLMLLGALLIYMLIFLTFVHGLIDTLYAIAYTCFFYMTTLIVVNGWQFGIPLILTIGIIFGIISYFIIRTISFILIVFFEFIPKVFFINKIIPTQ